MPAVKSATITLKKEDSFANIVVKSLHPETTRDIPRFHVNIKEDANTIYIEIEAEDISSLRAALNSYLRWMKLTQDTYYETQDKKN
jgi:KEOPS complex subunit Pcc1